MSFINTVIYALILTNAQGRRLCRDITEKYLIGTFNLFTIKSNRRMYLYEPLNIKKTNKILGRKQRRRHRLWVLVRTAKNKKNIKKNLKIYIFTTLIICILHGRVFVMYCTQLESSPNNLLTRHVYTNSSYSSQRAHDVIMTSYQRRCDVMTSHRRRFDVILTSCACWEARTTFDTTCLYKFELYLGYHQENMSVRRIPP